MTTAPLPAGLPVKLCCRSTMMCIVGFRFANYHHNVLINIIEASTKQNHPREKVTTMWKLRRVSNSNKQETKKEQAQLGKRPKARSTRHVCYRIQTQSRVHWGLTDGIAKCLATLGLEMIDHRTWHPPGTDSTVSNEIFCRSTIAFEPNGTVATDAVESLARRIAESLRGLFQDANAQINVHQWYPENAGVTFVITSKPNVSSDTTPKTHIPHRRRRRAQSTPVGTSGSLFGAEGGSHGALLRLNSGETHEVQISREALHALRSGRKGQVNIAPTVANQLQGLVRNSTETVSDK